MEKFKFGIIGASNIANKFCDAVGMIDEAEVAAVASATPEKAKSFAKKNGIRDYYSSYEQMLKRDDIDAVYISTTHNFHYANAMLCIENNKHFICEKAFALTKEEAEKVFAAARAKGVFSMEAMWSRFLPAINKAREWILQGRLGVPELATFTIGFKADENPQGRMMNPALAGGAMYDIGVYAIEIMTYLINEKIEGVESVITKAITGVDKVDSMIIRFENCVASLNCIITSNVPNEMHIFGTKGRIHIKNPHFSDTCTFYDENGKAEEYYSKLENGFEHQILELISCVRDSKLESGVIPHKDTIKCAEIFNRCLF